MQLFPMIQTSLVGMCIRDALGNFISARCSWSAPRLEVKEGEAVDLLQALRWASSLDLQHIIFELDS